MFRLEPRAMKMNAFVYSMIVVVLSGCAKPTADESLTKAQTSYEQARRDLDSLGHQADAMKLFAEPVEQFTRVTREHAGTPQAGEALFMIATICNNHTHEFGKAIDTYRQYVERFPQGDKAPISMFLMGYLYNNELHNLDSAAAVYRRFLTLFPSHELALSAQFELQTLGKSPEVLLPSDHPNTASAGTTKPASPRPKK